jgi:hypothetical protein
MEVVVEQEEEDDSQEEVDQVGAGVVDSMIQRELMAVVEEGRNLPQQSWQLPQHLHRRYSKFRSNLNFL